MYMYIHIYIYMYVYLCVYVYICICMMDVCPWGEPSFLRKEFFNACTCDAAFKRPSEAHAS